jgi:PAS domain S-box-containing protein
MKLDTAAQNGTAKPCTDIVAPDGSCAPEAQNGSARLTLRKGDEVKAPSGSVSLRVAPQPDTAGHRTALEGLGLTLSALTAIVESAGLPEMMSTLVKLLHDLTGVEAIGIRLKNGEDYPYYETYGIPLQFVRKDSALCSPNGKGEIACGFDGKQILECLCGNIIKGIVEHESPYYTERGSFWTNNLTEFLDSPSGRRLPEATRSRMAATRYGSVALVPVGSNHNNVGLIQFSDARPGLFTAALIEQFEQIAYALSQTIPRRMLRDDLEASRQHLMVARDELESEVQRRTADLVTANERLRREADERQQVQQELRQSEARFRNTFEQAAVGMAHVSPEGRFVRVNQRLCDIVGYSRDEMLAMAFKDITYSGDLEQDLQAVRGLATGEIPSYVREKRYVCKDGSTVWVGLTVSAVRDNTGELQHFVTVVEDISDRKRAEEAFRKVFSASPIPVILTRVHDNVIVKVNEAWHRFTGHSCESTVGKTATELGFWVDVDQRRELVTELMAKGRLTDVEVQVRTASGDLKCVQMAAEVIELDGERHLLTIAADRTERQKILLELERTNNTLRAERSMLENKNIALKEIMEQIDQYKRSTSQQLQANVNRVIRPMLQILTDKLSPADRRLVSLLDNTLQDLIDPFVGKLESLSYSLTPREMEVCHMIRNGFSSKQIASLLNVSVFTVNNQRRSIRRKLEIADGETHLESYLKRL